ncbi:MAG: hypothetical protein HRF49_02605 [bacterium]
MPLTFSWPGFAVSLLVIAFGIWGYRSERRFLSYLAPSDRLWSATLGAIINICLAFFCVVFTFNLWVKREVFAFTIALLIVFLLVVIIYLAVRWRLSLLLLGNEAKEGIRKLKEELERFSGQDRGGNGI